MRKILLVCLSTTALVFSGLYGTIAQDRSTSLGLESGNISTDFGNLVAPTDYTQQARIISGTPGDNFSALVAISGDTAVVYSTLGFFVFVRSGANWTQQALIMSSEGMFPFTADRSVAIDGDTIVLGGTSAETNAEQRGAAYVFVRNGTTWTQQARLVASDGAGGDAFGNSVAINGDTIIAGAQNDSFGTIASQGSAYVFTRNAGVWSEQVKLFDAGGGKFQHFGLRVAIQGATAVVSRAWHPGAPITGGSTYVFVRNGGIWTQQAQLRVCEPSGTPTLDACNFGIAISISGETLAVGNSSLIVDGQTYRGGVYVFNRDGTTWTQQQRIVANDGLANDGFGLSVSLQNDGLVVGSPAKNVRPGSVYLYSRAGTSWSMSQPRIQKASPNASNYLGESVAVAGNNLIFGASRDEGTPGNLIGAAYIYSNATKVLSAHPPFDFDGDSKTDVSIFRPGAGEWWVNRSSNGGNFALQFGASTDKLVPTDFTGDGKTDVAFWRPSTGQWFVLRSEDFSFYAFPFGATGDVPVPADYDGDGKLDAAVFRPSAATWYISRSTGGTTIQAFGIPTDLPVAADYDGDGKADLAVYRPTGANGAEWWISKSSGGTFATQFGSATDKAVPADYTGDGKADIAFWTPSNGQWFILRSEDLTYYAFPFGGSGDAPVPGDYDGDGKTDAAVFRPSNSTWFANRSTAGVLIQQFGQTGDIPVPNAFVR